MTLKIYSISLSLLGILDDYETASSQRSFFEAGSFTFEINKNLPNSSLVEKDNVVQFGDDTRAFLITSVVSKIDESGKGGQKLSVSGYDLRYLFTRRIVRTFNSADAYQLTAPSETVIKTLISDQCGPSCAIPARVFSLLQIATDQGRGGTYTISTKYTGVYDECATCATQALIGWRVDIDVANKKYILDCYEGVDRSKTQTVNPYCLFSPDADSIKDATFTDSVESYRNFVYVGGDGTGADRTVYNGYGTTEPTDTSRFELFSDSSSVSTTAGLEAVASSTLAQYKQTYTLDGQVLLVSPYVFGEQYEEGDIVTVEYSGISVGVRVLTVEEAWAFAEKTIAVTWGKPVETISSQVSSVSSTATTASSTSEVGTNVSGMKAGVKSYDLTSADATMNASQCIYNILELTGTLSANRTMTLYLDTSTLYGRKAYTVNIPAATLVASSGGPYTITLTTGVSGKKTVAVPILITGSTALLNGLVFAVYVDAAGNVYSTNQGEQPVAVKTTLVDADEITGNDSANSFRKIRITFANLWTWLKSKAGAGSGWDSDLWDGVHRPLNLGSSPVGITSVGTTIYATLTQVLANGFFGPGCTDSPMYGASAVSAICIGGGDGETRRHYLAFGMNTTSSWHGYYNGTTIVWTVF
jgi:hypothetical protein